MFDKKTISFCFMACDLHQRFTFGSELECTKRTMMLHIVLVRNYLLIIIHSESLDMGVDPLSKLQDSFWPFGNYDSI